MVCATNVMQHLAEMTFFADTVVERAELMITGRKIFSFS